MVALHPYAGAGSWCYVVTSMPRMFALVVLMSIGLTAGHADESKPGTVVFVCEHGSVKSLMAATLFDEGAKERGLAVRAVSRGITPDARVPDKIAEALNKDGVDVTDFRPAKVAPNDIRDAMRVVTIGVDPSALTMKPAALERWDGIPAASEDYAAAKAALYRRVQLLLDELNNPDR